MRHCECGDEIPLNPIIDGKRRNLRNRSKCLKCQPFGSSVYQHRYTAEEKLGRKRQRKAKNQRDWRDRIIEKTGVDPIRTFRQKRKAFVISVIGGTCQLCGYDKRQRNLVFHHLHNKTFALSQRGFQYSAKKLVPEIHKCVLVCHNCHGEIHDSLVLMAKLRQCNKHIRRMVKISDNWPTSKT